jgi:glycosyltransferase involved in cell wall biosynthesis
MIPKNQIHPEWRSHPSHLQKPRVQVILPVHDEQANLPVLYQRLHQTLADCSSDWNLIFVDDGSRDGGPQWLSDLASTDPRVTVITLARNFGHQAAVTVGLGILRDHSEYDIAIVMDTDLQDPPELIQGLIREWESGSDVVHAVRKNRRESAPKRLAYWAFYRIYKALAEVDVPLDSGDFCLLSARAVDALNQLPERARFHRGLRAYIGFKQTTLPYDRPERMAGHTKYNFAKLLRLALDGLVCFSSVPLRLVSLMGIGTFLASLCILGWVLADALLGHTAPRGWASLAALVLLSASVQMIALGIVGEYLRQIFLETKGRPAAIVANISGQRFKTQGSRATRYQPEHHGLNHKTQNIYLHENGEQR